MFRREECTIELAQKFGNYMAELSQPVRFEAEKTLPITRFSLFSYEKETSTYYFGLREPKMMMKEIWVDSLGKFNETDFLKGFHIFTETIGLLKERKWLFGGDEHFADPVIKMMTSLNWDRDNSVDRTFYIPDEKSKLLLDSPPLPVPKGYELGSGLITDSELITNTWKYNLPGEEAHTRQKLTVFPSSCIRCDGIPVAFEMVHPSGMLNHLFVFPEHRGKGLALIVEQDLCRKLIRAGYPVYKNVEIENTGVIKGTEESPFWSTKFNEKGEPLFRKFIAFWQK